MNQDQLTALKGQILNDITPLALSNDNSRDRFDLLLRVIQAGGASSEVYARAYESAKQIEDRDDQLDALLVLLDEIDFDTTMQPTGEQPAPAPQEQQAAPEQMQNTEQSL